jgi:alkanesulfonate monooxygenase SsuD/methylene tetrahydromethanopterin reductase-like flavin-dependent oxidoreductase (luciferase family)
VMAITQMYCAPTKAEALRDGGQYATNYYRFFSGVNAQARVGTVPAEYQTMRGEDLDADNRVLLGDPEDLVPRIKDLEDKMGVDFLLMEVAQGGAPPEKVVKALELFGREVLPHVQGKKKPALAGAAV